MTPTPREGRNESVACEELRRTRGEPALDRDAPVNRVERLRQRVLRASDHRGRWREKLRDHGDERHRKWRADPEDQPVRLVRAQPPEQRVDVVLDEPGTYSPGPQLFGQSLASRMVMATVTPFSLPPADPPWRLEAP